MKAIDADPMAAWVVKSAAQRAPYRWAPDTDKVFISDVYDQVVADGRDDGMTLAEFKAILADLRRGGFVKLERADLVAAMPPERVARSEMTDGIATFHFVRAPMKTNPEWITHAVAINYDLLEEKVPPAWLPKLVETRPGPKGTMTVELKEYGCGMYGCVLPTLDPTVVLKVTTDDTEAEFAAHIAESLVAPVAVTYHMVMGLAARHQGRKIYLLWREAADQVGKIVESTSPLADTYIGQQWDAAQVAYKSIQQKRAPAVIRANIGAWLERVDQMAYQRRVPELVQLAVGMIRVWHDQHVFFGDIHAGNLGLVHRPGGDAWVITDPGHVAVIED